MKGNISQGRINKEVQNMLKDPLPYLKAMPLQNDLYTWHFTIQGPQNSDFHEGLYHGQILLPFQYPFKPPDIVFMNKNGRFQTNTKICLTITQYHPEQWNSAWTIRTMLQAVISLFNQNIQGIGYEQGSPQQRKLLAKKSHEFKCDKCGILKDVLKPREPQKQQEKKQEQKNDQNFGALQEEKLQYASQISFRKIKTEDNRLNVSIKQHQLETKQPKTEQFNNKIKQQRQANKNLKTKDEDSKSHKKQQQSQIDTPTYKFYCPENNLIGLDKKIHKNFISWAKVLKSQKWSVIQ